MFDSVSIQDYAGSSKKSEERLRSRIIGTEGKTRKTIELMTIPILKSIKLMLKNKMKMIKK